MSSCPSYTVSWEEEVAVHKDELTRLKHEFEIVQAAVMDGRLFHSSIPENIIKNGAIADFKGPKGIWIREVARRYPRQVDDASTEKIESSMLISFQTSEDISNRNVPGSRTVAHDCTLPFEEEWHGKFDVVNIRFVAAVKEGGLRQTVQNAFQLLKPGGYIQWLDRDALASIPIPSSSEIEKTMSNGVSYCSKNGNVLNMTSLMLSGIRSMKYDNADEPSAGTVVDGFEIIIYDQIRTGTAAAID